MKTYWILLVFLQGFSPVTIHGFESLEDCRQEIYNLERITSYRIPFSPLKQQYQDVFCVSNKFVIKSKLTSVT